MKLTTALFYLIATIAAVRDWREHRIPNGCCVAIVFITFVEWTLGSNLPLREHILGGIAVSVPMFLIALCVKGSFGGGDVKFMAACGLFLGWRVIWTSAVCAVGAAGVYAVVLLCRGYDKRTYIPLGPFLVFGMLVGRIMC